MRELALYLAAGVAYIALGVAVPELLFSWIEGALFLLLAVWVLPALLARRR
jgi:putative Ca2+/H+ antiporter (TMEM165/GDT1 family)